MDTKWKNRIILILWLVLFTFGVSGVLTALLNDQDYMKTSYFKTSQYRDTVGTYASYLHAFEMDYQSKEDMKEAITVSKEEIDEYRFMYGELSEQISSIEEQYVSRIQEAQANNNQDQANLYIKERDAKIADITKNFESDEYVEEKIRKEKEQRVDEYYKDLATYRQDFRVYDEAFSYFLVNTSTGEVFTNLPTKDQAEVDKYISSDKMLHIDQYPSKNNGYLDIAELSFIYGYEDLISHDQANSLYEGKIGLREGVSSSNAIMVSYKQYDQQRKLFWIYTIGAIVALFASLFIGRKIQILNKISSHKSREIYNKLPLDLAVTLTGITLLISLVFITDFPNLYNYYTFRDVLNQLFIMSVFLGLTIIQLIFLYPIVKDLSKNREILRKTMTARFLKIIREAFYNRRVGTQVLLILGFVYLFGLGAGPIFIEPEFMIAYVPAFFIIGIPVFILIVRKVGYFNKITRNAHALASGQFEPDLKVVGKSVLAKLAEDINTMKHGVKTSQKAQAKSERLKTELITNVSHDLRTPLTSIITYSELLKNPELTEDERSTYIEIIDRKSKRLKVLIDDLFEASKMASGNIELSKTKVDIVQLLQQSLAEYNETIQASTIQFRITNPDSPVYALIDGQKLWRVFDNLIGNIIKYSLEHTRAYIAIKVDNSQIIISFKNISKYELSDDVDELFERFKRGDTSRHTDGSGLGLAIAKSIIDLHEGHLDIDVDGDLFKVTIVLENIE